LRVARAALLMLLAVLVSASLAAAAQTPGAGQAAPLNATLERGTKDFARNAALGAVLSKRPGTPAELRELQELADGGLRAARELAGKYPQSVEASYLLGSWLIYGYHVVKTRQVTVNATAGATSEVTERVVQGLSDDPQEGLGALQRAEDLDPKRGQYVVDYGTALVDCGRDAEAMSFLKATWSGNGSLTAQEKMQIGLLLSDVSAHRGDLAEAREWVYSALEAVPENRAMAAYLRSLDATLPPMEAEVAAAEAAAKAEAAAAAATGEEGAPSQSPGGTAQVAPEPTQQGPSPPLRSEGSWEVVP
jgi:hypothetical protein